MGWLAAVAARAGGLSITAEAIARNAAAQRRASFIEPIP
jgi:hypothetical protein